MHLNPTRCQTKYLWGDLMMLLAKNDTTAMKECTMAVAAFTITLPRVQMGVQVG